MPHINTILFDCDNTLVKSEALAFGACAGLANEILEKAGKPERYTGPKLQHDFVGQNFRGMLNGLVDRHGLSLSPSDVDEYVSQELAVVTKSLIEGPVQPCDNVFNALKEFDPEGPNADKYLLAVVSSSAYPRVKTALEVAKMDKYFGDRIYSAATSLPVPTSKPDPAIYLHTCTVLNKKPTECVAIEDSKSGATAAVRAGIPLIGYVGVYEDETERKEVAKMLEDLGAIAIMYDWKDFDECLKKVHEAPAPSPKI